MITVSIAKTHTVDVDEAKFSPDVKSYIYNYGLKQILNDAGSAGKDADEKLAMAEKKLAALYEGTVRAARESDPVKAEMRRIATPMALVALMKKYGLKKKSDVDDKELRSVVGQIIESPKYAPEIRETAEAAVTARKGLTVDVDDLDL